VLTVLHYSMVAEENDSSRQEFHCFNGIAWAMVSGGVDCQAHRIVKGCALGIHHPGQPGIGLG